MATLNLSHGEILVSPGFQVCMIYEDELNLKIASMMKGMNFMLGMGLGKDQQSLSSLKFPFPNTAWGFREQER